MLKLEIVNGFARILDGGVPLVDVMFSHSPHPDSVIVAKLRLSDVIDAANLESPSDLRTQLTDAQLRFKISESDNERLRRENSQMRQAIVELKRQIANARKAANP